MLTLSDSNIYNGTSSLTRECILHTNVYIMPLSCIVCLHLSLQMGPLWSVSLKLLVFVFKFTNSLSMQMSMLKDSCSHQQNKNVSESRHKLKLKNTLVN